MRSQRDASRRFGRLEHSSGLLESRWTPDKELRLLGSSRQQRKAMPCRYRLKALHSRDVASQSTDVLAAVRYGYGRHSYVAAWECLPAKDSPVRQGAQREEAAKSSNCISARKWHGMAFECCIAVSQVGRIQGKFIEALGK
jgi:hypothetical protein